MSFREDDLDKNTPSLDDFLAEKFKESEKDTQGNDNTINNVWNQVKTNPQARLKEDTDINSSRDLETTTTVIKKPSLDATSDSIQ